MVLTATNVLVSTGNSFPVTRVFGIALRSGVIAAIAGGAAVLIGVALALVHWTFDFAALFLLPATIAVAAASLVALMMRTWRVALAGGLVTISLVATTFYWTASPPAVDAKANRFTVLIFNVYWRNPDLAAVAAMIGKTNADMVILLESSEKLRDAVAALPYPYRLDCLGIGPCDMIVLSRSRLLARQTLTTGDPTNSPILTLQTEIAGCRLTLIGTHLTRPWPFDVPHAQWYQADEVGGEVGGWPGAKLVVGDFNAVPWGYTMRTIAREGRVSILTGGGGTWPSWAPPQFRAPIDNMLAGEGLSFVSRRVLPTVGSDHAPVLAEVAVTDQSKCLPN